ncbi:polysaccharide deacetylase family protein [Simkania negevensis]|uniref:Polysaccharide deacetylase family protein n=1 Tax=Simkania negevensis TaxID=83561 RepID=A0ABS3ARZ3_9BACT|nr:polysaccharide deacetylase family protein [Simkania negevensis]
MVKSSSLLLVLMYHRVYGRGKHENPSDLFSRHLAFIKERFPVKLPGEPLEQGKLNVCPTFDDGYCDFYFNVFPLLKELSLKAVLALPVKYIAESTDLSPAVRMDFRYVQAMDEGFYQKRVPFCTWQEIREMVGSGLIEVASHSFSHVDCSKSSVNLQQELVCSKQIIEDNIDRKVETFVYPFGKTNRTLEHTVARHYRYGIRIGGACNMGWHQLPRSLCRVSGDRMEKPNSPFTFKQLWKPILKGYLRRFI